MAVKTASNLNMELANLMASVEEQFSEIVREGIVDIDVNWSSRTASDI